MLNKRTSEPHVLCSRCSHLISLTESLDAPLIEAEREIHRRELDAKESGYRQRMDDVRRKEEELAQAQAARRIAADAASRGNVQHALLAGALASAAKRKLETTK